MRHLVVLLASIAGLPAMQLSDAAERSAAGDRRPVSPAAGGGSGGQQSPSGSEDEKDDDDDGLMWLFCSTTSEEDSDRRDFLVRPDEVRPPRELRTEPDARNQPERPALPATEPQGASVGLSAASAVDHLPVATATPQGPVPYSSVVQPKRIVVGVGYQLARPSHDDQITALHDVWLSIGADGDRFGGALRGMIGGVDVDDGSLAQRGLSQLATYGLELEGTGYLLDRDAWCSPYASLALGGGTLRWEYQNSLVGSDGGEITEDRLIWLQLRAVAGLAIARGARLSGRIEAGVIGRAYDNETKVGFENDLFDDGVMPVFSGGLLFRF